MKKKTCKVFCLTDMLDNSKDVLMVFDDNLTQDNMATLIGDYFTEDENLMELYDESDLRSDAQDCAENNTIVLDDCEYYIEDAILYY